MSYICQWINKIPVRLNIGIMFFFGAFFSYIMRVNMSISILAMVQSTIPDENGTIPELPDVNNNYFIKYSSTQ